MSHPDSTSEQMLRRELSGRRVLILEDETVYSEIMIDQLYSYGVERIDLFTTGEAARDAAMARRYDVLLLDRKNPGIDGLKALRDIRACRGPSSDTPALLITSAGGRDDLTEGLIHGADDYIIKPADELELIARIAAQIRGAARRPRLGSAKDGLISNGPLTINEGAKTASLFDEPLPVSGKALDILIVLTRSVGLTVTNSMLLQTCWPSLTIYTDGWSNMIYQRVHKLSRAIGPFAERRLHVTLQPIIVNVRGEGYYMRDLAHTDGIVSAKT